MATKKPVTKRDEYLDNVPHQHQHLPVQTNGLKIKLDNLNSFQPLTDNQKVFFDSCLIRHYCN